jgi:hypothetical protein
MTLATANYLPETTEAERLERASSSPNAYCGIGTTTDGNGTTTADAPVTMAFARPVGVTAVGQTNLANQGKALAKLACRPLKGDARK